ncbi:acyl carrier protein [Aeromonas veronii]|uniref:acyl carrier protein n=1 Tax=Aeromonas TaxID=642 RepID=UPI00224CFC87|nr:acyl carrier protein [Aeromonas veronii]MCX4043223.1 acyl carrier protein [Aeromonas veronii]HDN9004759.1 acyl carrier protein [Aeromonas veronii]
MTDLFTLLEQQFPSATVTRDDYQLGLGAFPEWDSLGHFNFLLLVEQTFSVRFEPEELAKMKQLQDIREALLRRGLAL